MLRAPYASDAKDAVLPSSVGTQVGLPPCAAGPVAPAVGRTAKQDAGKPKHLSLELQAPVPTARTSTQVPLMRRPA